jgi:hypothetical protein
MSGRARFFLWWALGVIVCSGSAYLLGYLMVKYGGS